MPRKPKKYHYIYKTTNILNNKFYIGMHSTDDLNDGYIGSGTRLWRSINKHGKENHDCEILEYLPDRKSLKAREREIVNSDLIQEMLCMNLVIGGSGDGTWEYANSVYSIEKRREVGRKSQEKMKWLRENDPTWVANLFAIASAAGKLSYEQGRSNHKHIDWSGKKHTEKTKQKMRESKQNYGVGSSNSQYGTCWVYSLNNKENKKIQKTELETYLQNNWIKGRKMNFYKTSV